MKVEMITEELKERQKAMTKEGLMKEMIIEDPKERPMAMKKEDITKVEMMT